MKYYVKALIAFVIIFILEEITNEFYWCNISMAVINGGKVIRNDISELMMVIMLFAGFGIMFLEMIRSGNKKSKKVVMALGIIVYLLILIILNLIYDGVVRDYICFDYESNVFQIEISSTISNIVRCLLIPSVVINVVYLYKNYLKKYEIDKIKMDKWYVIFHDIAVAIVVLVISFVILYFIHIMHGGM